MILKKSETKIQCSCVSHFFVFSTTSWIFPIRSSSFKITSCAIPSILMSTFNSGSFSTVDSSLRSSFLERMTLGHLSSCLNLLPALFPLSAPVAWCEKTHSQRCLLVAAAAIAKHSQIQSSVRDEASRVQRIKFVSLFEKSLCRCNLPPQNCFQLRH